MNRVYRIGRMVTALLVFVGCWTYCSVQYGFLFGFGLGWLPSAIAAFIVGWLWPVPVALAALASIAVLVAASPSLAGWAAITIVWLIAWRLNHAPSDRDSSASSDSSASTALVRR